MMARILFFCVLLVAVRARTTHKYPNKSEETNLITKVVCNSTFDEIRDEVIEKSRCGAPKEVFEELKSTASFLRVDPSHVWVKRCVGLCDFDAPDSTCVPTRIRKQPIPVQIYNVKTKKQTCSIYHIDVHESCGCCSRSSEDCLPPKVFNPRKCSCQCPNLEERRTCLKQRNLNMKWNRSKCTCEQRRSFG